MIQLRTKKIEKAAVINDLPDYNIRINLLNNNVRVSPNLFTAMNLATNYIGVGCDRENDKYYVCLSNESTGFKPNGKNLTFTNKKLVDDWRVWFNIDDSVAVLYLKVNFEMPISQDDITYYQTEILKTEVKKMELA